ncbi:MAG: hypothetical protein AAGG69_09785 [Pseudomonadota bacterium]
MNQRLILHVGHPKTGSTSIQKALAANRRQLEKEGIFYPETALLSHNHRVLGFAIDEDKTSSLRLRLSAQYADPVSFSLKEWDRVSSAFQVSPADTLLLSSESIFNDLWNFENAKRLQDRISHLNCREVVGLCYMRSPGPFYLSRAQQKLRGGFGLLPLEAPERVLRIDFFKQIFGINFEMRVFERHRLKDGDVVSDFMSWIDRADLEINGHTEQLNTSVSAEAMAVLAELSATTPPANMAELKRQRKTARFVMKLDTELENPTKPKLRSAIAEHIIRLDSDLVVLRDRHQIEFSDVDYGIAGKLMPGAQPEANSVDDICHFDVDRAYELKGRVKDALSEYEKRQENMRSA